MKFHLDVTLLTAPGSHFATLSGEVDLVEAPEPGTVLPLAGARFEVVDVTEDSIFGTGRCFLFLAPMVLPGPQEARDFASQLTRNLGLRPEAAD